MKLPRVISIVLIVLTAFCWLSFIFGSQNEEEKQFKLHCSIAEDYVERGLYQKAIEEYDQALIIEPLNQKTWTDKMTAFEYLYSENKDSEIFDQYLAAASTSVMTFPDDPKFLITLANLYVYKEDYIAAYKTLSRGIEGGIDDDDVEMLLFRTKYAFSTSGIKYSECIDCMNGYYEVLSYDRWEYIDTECNLLKFPNYKVIGPVGEDSMRFVADDSRCLLINGDKVIQGFFNVVPDEVGVYGDGLIPLKVDSKYSYYNSLGEVQFDGAEFDYAGTFFNGTAAVKIDSVWYIIDKDGVAVSEDEYDDVILNVDGTYNRFGIVSVKHKGDSGYTVSVNDKEIGKYDNVGVASSDGIISVFEHGKWGYIDLEGTTVVEPKFIEARSFSNGLAAVFDGVAWGFINKDGQLAIPYQYHDVGYFTDKGSCMVSTGEEKTDENNKKYTVYSWNMITLYVN